VGSLLCKVLVGGDWLSKSAAASKGVVVAFLGLAELVDEEDHGLQAQDQHDATDEACSVEGVVRARRGAGCDRREIRIFHQCCLCTIRGGFGNVLAPSECQNCSLTCRGWSRRGGDVTIVSGHNGAACSGHSENTSINIYTARLEIGRHTHSHSRH